MTEVKKQCQTVSCYFHILYSSPKTCCAAMMQLFKYTLKEQWDQYLKYFFCKSLQIYFIFMSDRNIWFNENLVPKD